MTFIKKRIIPLLFSFLLGFTFVHPLSEKTPPLCGAATFLGSATLGLCFLNKHFESNQPSTTKKVLCRAGVVGGSFLLGWYVHTWLAQYTPTHRYAMAKKIVQSVTLRDMHRQKDATVAKFKQALGLLWKNVEEYQASGGNKKLYNRTKHLMQNIFTLSLSVSQKAFSALGDYSKFFLVSHQSNNLSDEAFLQKLEHENISINRAENILIAAQEKALLARTWVRLIVDFDNNNPYPSRLDNEIAQKISGAHTLYKVLSPLIKRINKRIALLQRLRNYLKARKVARDVTNSALLQRLLLDGMTNEQFVSHVQNLYRGSSWYSRALTEVEKQKSSLSNALHIMKHVASKRDSFAPDSDDYVKLLQQHLSRVTTKWYVVKKVATYYNACDTFQTLRSSKKSFSLFQRNKNRMTDGQVWKWAKQNYSFGAMNRLKSELDEIESSLTYHYNELSTVLSEYRYTGYNPHCQKIKSRIKQVLDAVKVKKQLVNLYSDYRSVKRSYKQFLRSTKFGYLLRNDQVSSQRIVRNLETLDAHNRWPLLRAEVFLNEEIVEMNRLVEKAHTLYEKVHRHRKIVGLAVKTLGIERTILHVHTKLSRYLHTLRSSNEYRLQQRTRNQVNQPRVTAPTRQNQPMPAPTLFQSNGPLQHEDENATCGICLEGCNDDTSVAILQCCNERQFLHRECFDSVKNTNNRCPFCRAEPLQARFTQYGDFRN